MDTTTQLTNLLSAAQQCPVRFGAGRAYLADLAGALHTTPAELVDTLRGLGAWPERHDLPVAYDASESEVTQGMSTYHFVTCAAIEAAIARHSAKAAATAPQRRSRRVKSAKSAPAVSASSEERLYRSANRAMAAGAWMRAARIFDELGNTSMPAAARRQLAA